MRVFRDVFFLAMMAFVGVANAQSASWEKIYAELQPEFKQAVEVTVEEVSRNPAEGDAWQFVDVRTSDEQRVSMIPGAITFKQFEADPQRYRQVNLVAYCTIGYRSGIIATKWRGKGYNFYNLKGGVLAWANAGKLFLTPSGELSKFVHVYGKDWNLLPPGYKAVW